MQVMEDVFETVMSARASLRAQPHSSNRQIEVVTDDQYILWLHLVPACKFAHCLAAAIHKRNWLGQDNLLRTNHATGKNRPAAPFRPLPSMFSR